MPSEMQQPAAQEWCDGRPDLHSLVDLAVDAMDHGIVRQLIAPAIEHALQDSLEAVDLDPNANGIVLHCQGQDVVYLPVSIPAADVRVNPALPVLCHPEDDHRRVVRL